MACEIPVEPSVQIGTGDSMFEPLVDGDEITVIQGPQDGYHVLGSVLVTGLIPGDGDDIFDPSNPTQHFQVHDGDERVDVSNPFAQGLDPSEERGVFQTLGRFVFLDIEDDSELEGHTLTLSFSIVDADGLELSTSVDVLAVSSPFNE